MSGIRSRAYARLKQGQGEQHVAFTYAIPIALQYKNAAGVWVEFVPAAQNTHEKAFDADGRCRLKVTGSVGNPVPASEADGPWLEAPQVQ
jgi:hypothetical protein